MSDSGSSSVLSPASAASSSPATAALHFDRRVNLGECGCLVLDVTWNPPAGENMTSGEEDEISFIGFKLQLIKDQLDTKMAILVYERAEGSVPLLDNEWARRKFLVTGESLSLTHP